VTGFRWEKIVVGEYHSCALDDAGRAYCWGHNSTGQLGDGTLTDRRVPTPVAGDRRFRWIAAGGLQSCGVTLDGDGYCWGRGVALGHGVWTNSPVPVLVLGGHSWRSIDMGIWHACGVTTAGEGYCWGYGSNGRLGTGSTTDQAEPVLLAGRVFEMISAGRDHSCGVAAGGAALCWGYGGWGQLGNGAGASALSPTPVSGTGLLWDVVSAGGAHSCGVLQDGRGACWGYGYQGQLGVGARGYTFGPLVVAGGWELASVDAGAHHTCATTTDGAGLCWGYGSEGQIGNGDFPIAQQTPAEVAGGLDFSFVSAAGAPYVLGESASGGFSCGITTNGGIFCWGDNLYGQIGDGTSARRRLLPTPIRDP
jgi:alpha-tubulin suppressor-like RCC1 family protein